MNLTTDMRVFWTGTFASIPANFSRDTDFDDRYLQGDSVAGSNGGSSTHLHISSSHEHILHNHTHLMSITGASSGTVGGTGGFGTSAASGTHIHEDVASGISSTPSPSPGESSTASIDTTAASPQFIEVIVLEPDDGNQKIPQDASVFAQSINGMTNITQPAAFDGRFIKSTTGSGNGGATGGSLTHIHTSPAHSHTYETHDHPTSEFGPASSSSGLVGGLGVLSRESVHHQTTFASKAITIDATSLTIDPASSEPKHTVLLAVQMDVTQLPEGVIVAYVGTEASIPEGWFLCDGQSGTPNIVDRQVKCSLLSSDVGALGGFLLHTHNSPKHSHTGTGHTHLGFPAQINSLASNASVTSFTSSTHTHAAGGGDAESSPSTSSTAVGLDLQDTRQTYRTVLWIQFGLPPTTVIKGGIIKGGTWL